MERNKHSFSVFAYPADRGTYLAYFLGAIVPLLILGVVAERFVLAPIGAASDSWYSAALSGRGIAGLLVSVTMLSLGCFFMLRRLVRRAIDENLELAYYDSLTGLPNRRMFKDRVGQALRHADRTGHRVAVCFIDLDGFKTINDTLGHDRGDQILREVSDRFVASIRLSDSISRRGTDSGQTAIARLGGDEFTLLLTDLRDPKDAGRAARRLINALREPFVLDGHEIHTTASIGIAVAPVDGDDVNALLQHADVAMYAAKDAGRNDLRFYSESMNRSSERKLAVENRLRRALEHDELALHYQPILDATNGTTKAVEALLRWDDPELGVVSPAEFVPVAEDAGLIVQIGEWVLRTAFCQARVWQDAGFHDVRVAVNVSGHQVRQPTFVARVAGLLEESGVSAGTVELEITESTVMQDDELTNAAFRGLDELGLGLVLDDFGTGYSSLSYLRRFNISSVKIDRSFVSGIPTSVDDMARNRRDHLDGAQPASDGRRRRCRERGAGQVAAGTRVRRSTRVPV